MGFSDSQSTTFYTSINQTTGQSHLAVNHLSLTGLRPLWTLCYRHHLKVWSGRVGQARTDIGIGWRSREWTKLRFCTESLRSFQTLSRAQKTLPLLHVSGAHVAPSIKYPTTPPPTLRQTHSELKAVLNLWDESALLWSLEKLDTELWSAAESQSLSVLK